MRLNRTIGGAALLATVSAATLAIAQDAPGIIPGEGFPNQVFFGDTHLHTSYSTDAGMTGTTLGPAESYRFAKGETVVSSMGIPARLQRPLNSLVEAVHAEGLGVAPMIARSDQVLLADPSGKELHDLTKAGDGPEAYNRWIRANTQGTKLLGRSADIPIAPWEEIIDAAEAANQPGAFTAFIGYELTSHPGGRNLHRVIVYRDGKHLANSRIPLSAQLNPDPEALWDWMADYEAETGGKALAIPHNGNLSNGLMFDDVTRTTQEPLSANYAQPRARWKPLYEVTQPKGDSETHPILSPDDPFADFETWDKDSFGTQPKTPDMLPREYAREALKRGLAYGVDLGTNPIEFAMIGSTDMHTGLTAQTEVNFFGKVAQLEPTADPIRFEEPIIGRLGNDPSMQIKAWESSAAGLAGIWARENMREALRDAMMRKEVFATTGTRLRVRVFAGYDFVEPDLPRSDFAAHGYDNGVPMGGDLGASDGRPPRFLVRALRDPDGANLDRIQIVKGWLNADGTTSERVYDIACDGRDLVATDCDGDVGNTVVAEEATYTNDIGQAILAGYWEDPEFDAAQHAFYYVRVLEIPTPRRTTFDAKVFGVDISDGAPISIQERACTSPIW